MMDYELFKEVVKEKFLEHMPDEFADFKVEIHQEAKVNKIIDSLSLIPPEGRQTLVMPSMSVNRMYEDYKENENLQDTLAVAAFHLAGAYRTVPDKSIVDRVVGDNRDNIVMVLVNTEQNRELLKNAPHREFQDLSVIYRVVASMDEEQVYSAIIKNNLMDRMGLNEEQLFKLAVENTKRLFPPTVKSINEVLYESMMQDGMPEELAKVLLGEIPEDKMMYVISNKQNINGAVSMLYENNLHGLAEQLESDLYILPSSINEVIAIPTKGSDPSELAEMVVEVNMREVELDERLSNQVYHYDKDLRKLTLATDTPNKRLDGMVAEAPLIYETKQSR